MYASYSYTTLTLQLTYWFTGKHYTNACTSSAACSTNTWLAKSSEASGWLAAHLLFSNCTICISLLLGNASSVHTYTAPAHIQVYLWAIYKHHITYNLKHWWFIRGHCHWPPARPPRSQGNWTVKDSCRQNCVLPLALSPHTSVIPPLIMPPVSNQWQITADYCT